MTVTRFGKKVLKITGYILCGLVIIAVAFHFWFIHHAKELLEDTVSKKTNGKIKLQIHKLHYNYFTRRMVLDKAVFYTTDTLTAPSAYRFSITELRLDLKAILPLIMNKRLLIDSLYLQSPDIQVTTLRYSKDTIQKKKEDISIPYEMGKVYHSIQDALQVLQVTRFQIEDGKFTLLNKVQTGQQPLIIGKIHFHIDNLKVDTAQYSGKEKFMFSDNVVLRSHDQNILFPDRRHRLSFSRFRINLQQRLVEFDSCTIEATKKDSAGSSFKVFFDALLLTNIDFDTLYRAEVIKADSVYCINPKFMLDVELGKNKDNKKAPPKLENIIKQLTGDLQLGFVIVENADFNIKTIKDGKPSSFTFSKNNFELQGLSVDQDEAKPIKVQSFTMAIRNYENFIKDSSYSVKFDSVVFKNDRITLNNFLFNKLENGKITNTFSVPQFSLEGLSWDYLVFEKRLKARLATMYRPHISYTASGNKSKGAPRQTIFQSLSTVNDYMDLDQLEIIQGNIDLKLKDNVQVQLDNATLSVQSHSLLTSTKLSGIKSSLTNLAFDRGKIRAGDLFIHLEGIRYAGLNGQFAASLATINSKEKNIAASLQNIAVKKLVVDELKGNVTAEGINWEKATIDMDISAGNKKANTAIIDLKNIYGTNTNINTRIGNKTVSTQVRNLSLDEILIKPGTQPVLTGLAMTGTALKAILPTGNLSVAAYHIEDNKNSFLKEIRYKSSSGKMKADISISLLTTVPHIQPMINGDLAMDILHLTHPSIRLELMAAEKTPGAAPKNFPQLHIGEISLTQPSIYFSHQNDSGKMVLNWQGQQKANNKITLNGLQTSGTDGMLTNIEQLGFNITDFSFTNTTGKTITTGDGKLEAQLTDIHLSQQEGDNLDWSGTINHLSAKDFRFDSTGKPGGVFVLNQVALKNFLLSSATITSLQKLANANPSFQVKDFTGHYADDNIQLRWHNIGFNRGNNLLTLDSFAYRPSLSRDSFQAVRKYQTDYIQTGAGAMQIGPLDIDRYIRDSSLHIGKALIDKAYLIDYKDKSLPFNSGLIKPLPVTMIKQLPFKLKIDSLLLSNVEVVYTEVNEKTKVAGTIPVNRMDVTILNLKNNELSSTDSLTIRATGYLLDTAWIRLRVKESYTDSLGGFLMSLRLKPGDLRVLNSSLIPLASVKLISGDLDTLDMRAIGREYLSLGEMKMFYRNLKIQLLKNGVESKKTIFTRFVSFIANTFIIKSNNKSRIGNVFYIRQRDRSAINYLIKISLSGMASSVGAKKNKKMIRKYKNELEKRNLPPIDFE